MAYRESDNTQAIEQGFETKLRELAKRLIQYGEQGEDIANYSEKKRQPEVVRTKRFMHESAIKLGLDLQNRFGNISYKEWVHWMQCCGVEAYHDRVVIKHYSQFFIDEASKRFAKTIEKHYDLPVVWEHSKNTAEYVLQWR